MEDARSSELQKYSLVEPNENLQVSERGEAGLQNPSPIMCQGSNDYLPTFQENILTCINTAMPVRASNNSHAIRVRSLLTMIKI